MPEKEHMISTRLTRQEWAKVKHLCETSGLSVSMLIRKLIDGVEIKQRPPEQLHELYTEVNRIGVNINQIARKANSGFATKQEMQELHLLMEAVARAMAEVAYR